MGKPKLEYFYTHIFSPFVYIFGVSSVICVDGNNNRTWNCWNVAFVTTLIICRFKIFAPTTRKTSYGTRWLGAENGQQSISQSTHYFFDDRTLVANTRFSARLHMLLIFSALYLSSIFPHPSSYTSHCERWPFAMRYMPNRGSIA